MRISDWSSDVCSSDLFNCTFVPVSHSIPEGNALLIETPYGRVFHTGDWKLDEAPVLGAPSTAAALDAIGDKGVLARSEEHTSELQSLMRISYAVFCLKKKKKQQ